MADTNTSKNLSIKLGTSSSSRKADDQIIVQRTAGVNVTQRITFSFQRTVRVADNGETNALPPSLGSFPIYRTIDYVKSLPEHIAGKPGFFVPMYRKCYLVSLMEVC